MQVISGFIKRVIESFIQMIPSNGRFFKNETDVCAWVIESLTQPIRSKHWIIQNTIECCCEMRYAVIFVWIHRMYFRC